MELKIFDIAFLFFFIILVLLSKKQVQRTEKNNLIDKIVSVNPVSFTLASCRVRKKDNSIIKASRELRDVDSYHIRGDFAFIVIQFE